jgi:hypothetical protein
MFKGTRLSLVVFARIAIACRHKLFGINTLDGLVQ